MIPIWPQLTTEGAVGTVGGARKSKQGTVLLAYYFVRSDDEVNGSNALRLGHPSG
jgi:hypothetical protein